MDTLKDYQQTGFTPDQINKMYENLCATNNLLTRLICGDYQTINEAVDDAIDWISGFASYSKEGIH